MSENLIETATLDDVREATRAVTSQFTDEYYRECDAAGRYPAKFVEAAMSAGLQGVMVPEEYGGWGLGVREACAIVEEINYSGGTGSYVHASMFPMSIIAEHGSEEQKQQWLPRVASGELKLTAFALTEPDAGTDTSKLSTTARLENGEWVFNGKKIFISRAGHTDLMMLMARTSASPDPKKPYLGISCFLFDIRDIPESQLTMRRIPMMMNHHPYELFIDNMRVPEDALIGEEGKGFRFLLDGLNAERIVVASQAIGDGRWFVDKSVQYANDRVLFGTPIGKNQGVQFPIAEGYINLEAASLMRWKAAELFDAGERSGAEANMAKHLAANASYELANVAMQTHGGYGIAKEYDIERKFRETRLYQVAPISTNLILSYVAEHILGLPRSY